MKWFNFFISFFAAVLLLGCGGGGSSSAGSASQKEWKRAEVLTRGDSRAYRQNIAIDDSGNAIAVWIQYESSGGYFKAYARRFVAGEGWSSTIVNLKSNGRNALNCQIALDAGGNGIAVWSQVDSSNHTHVYARRYIAGSGWSSFVIPLDETDNGAYTPVIAMNRGGEAIVAWKQSDGAGHTTVYAKRFTPSSGWGSATRLETIISNIYSLNIAMDSAGNAIVIWIKEDSGGNSAVYQNRYTAGAGWDTARVLNDTDGDVSEPIVAFDGSGNAIAAWLQTDEEETLSVYAKRYSPSSGWGAAVKLENRNSDASFLDIALDGSGNGFAVWSQGDETGNYSIFVSRYSAESGWGSPRLLENFDGRAKNPKIAVNSSGNAAVVWAYRESSDNYSIYANYYEPGNGWSGAVAIGHSTDKLENPKIAINESGDAIAVWNKDNSSRIYAARFEE